MKKKKLSYSKYWVAENPFGATLQICENLLVYTRGPYETLRERLKLVGCEEVATRMESWALARLRRTTPVAPQRSLLGSTDLVLVARDGVERAHQVICLLKLLFLIFFLIRQSWPDIVES